MTEWFPGHIGFVKGNLVVVSGVFPSLKVWNLSVVIPIRVGTFTQDLTFRYEPLEVETGMFGLEIPSGTL